MSQQLSLGIGYPSEPQYPGEYRAFTGWSMYSFTTSGFRALWAEDYLERIIHPDRKPLNEADCLTNNAARRKIEKLARQMLREGRASKRRSETRNHTFIEMNAGEGDQLSYFPQDASGEFDERLYAYDGNSRIPLVNVDGQVYRAGERGNDRKVILAEIRGTPFTFKEISDLLERVDSPKTWDRLIIHRMKVLKDLGPETERMILEENLSPETRDNLRYNLQYLREGEGR